MNSLILKYLIADIINKMIQQKIINYDQLVWRFQHCIYIILGQMKVSSSRSIILIVNILIMFSVLNEK